MTSENHGGDTVFSEEVSMRRFLHAVLFWGAMVALIGAALIDWQFTLSKDCRLGISFLLMAIAAGALWLAYRIRGPDAGAWMEGSRLRLVLASVMLVFMFSKGYFLLRDVRDLLHILPCKNWLQKEQIERDIDVLEACAYDKAHISHGHRLSLQSLENDHARHWP